MGSVPFYISEVIFFTVSASAKPGTFSPYSCILYLTLISASTVNEVADKEID